MIMTAHYFSYLLRIWQPDNQTADEWFASLENPKSREVVYFKNMEEMFAYLRELPGTKQNTDSDKIPQPGV